jgi:hypothetical protein
MIDADLQYPPEVIPDMLALAQDHGVVVAHRQSYQESPVRHAMSRGFQWFFGKLLHGLDCDVQSGLKLFKREIIEEVHAEDVTPWTLDIPLLTTALYLGFTIGEIDITFEKRTNGESKIQFVSSIREIGGHAIKHKFKAKKPRQISPTHTGSMIGAGLVHRGKKFVTHTTLHPNRSALDVLSNNQKFFLYKGVLLQRIEYFLDGKLALVHIPFEEIEQYSDKYNPSVLVLDEMRLVENVQIAIAIKTYPDGKLTGKLRSNLPISDQIAGYFGGGGHAYAAGFRVYENYDTTITELVDATEKVLREAA